MKNIVFCLLCLLIFSLYSDGLDKAPDFSLNNLAGQKITLSEQEGNIIVIDFWAMWCKACKEAFEELNSIQNEFKESKVIVYGINLEKANPAKVKKFVQKAGIKYDILLDPKGSTAKLFNVKGVPSLVIINKDGSIVKMFRGLNKKTGKDIHETLVSLTAN